MFTENIPLDSLTMTIVQLNNTKCLKTIVISNKLPIAKILKGLAYICESCVERRKILLGEKSKNKILTTMSYNVFNKFSVNSIERFLTKPISCRVSLTHYLSSGLILISHLGLN